MADHIINAITDYFKKCPLLRGGVFRVDALGPRPVEYVIETGMFTPILKTYVNGDTERQYQFSFGSREYYSMDRLQMMSASGFYEDLCDWVESQNRKGKLPELPEGMYADSIEVLSPGYIYDITGKNARYQMPMRLIYTKEA